MLKKEIRRKGIKKRIRKTVSGTKERPRLSVFRSNKQIYAQLIDDNLGCTLASANSSESEIAGNNDPKVKLAKLVGIAIANKAKQAGITTVVFDRGGYLYHGRVKSLAEGAREGGLIF
jgi:large subunit ribosomal protein L18